MKVEGRSHADSFVRKFGPVFLNVSLELLVERFADGRHRGQSKQLVAGERRISRPRRRKETGEAEFSAIEFAQTKGIGDSNATLQRGRALRLAQRKQTAKESKADEKKSQRTAHI
ncbi:MAG: hypothetical protein ACXWKP_01225 [Bradyrhizobium sp.]